MRLSRFNQYLRDFPEPGDTLIYNHITGGMVPVSMAGMELLRRINRGEATPEEAAQAEELTDPGYGMLVPNAVEDERRFTAQMDLLRKNKRHLALSVSTNLACNFDCVYCCQNGVLSGKTMSFEIAHETGKWIALRMRSQEVESVDINFLGGEPLLHPHTIESIARHVGKAASELGVAFTFDLTTNGWFLDRKMAERLRSLGCSHAKVTLDGDAETHNRTRPQKGGEGSFDRIWGNLLEASPILPVVLTGNYNPDTIEGFRRLLIKLRKAGLTDRQIPSVDFKPAIMHASAPESSACRSSRMSELSAEVMLDLADEVRGEGFSSGIEGTSLGPCGFHNANVFAIDAEGYLYKCPGFVGESKWAIGTVRSQDLGPLYNKALSAQTLLSCGDCENRPSCAGGCVATAWMQSGSTEDTQCDKPFFQLIAADALKRKWRREQQPAAQGTAA